MSYSDVDKIDLDLCVIKSPAYNYNIEFSNISTLFKSCDFHYLYPRSHTVDELHNSL
jgi:hypothetical protein